MAQAQKLNLKRDLEELGITKPAMFPVGDKIATKVHESNYSYLGEVLTLRNHDH